MENIYIYVNSFVLVVIFAMIFLSLKHKEEEEHSTPFIFVLIFMSIWTASSTLELVFQSHSLKLLAINMTQFGMAFVSVCNYWFVMSYAGLEAKMHKVILKVFIVLNIIAMLLLFTDPLHHLLRSEVRMGLKNGVSKLMITPTAVGSIFIAFRFVLFAYATLVLSIFLFKTYKKMRHQVLTLLIGFLLALVLLVTKQYVLKEFGASIPMSTILILPYVFVGISIFRYDFLSISPVANEWIIDSLTDGIVVISRDGQIVEKNPSAEEFLNKFGSQVDIKAIMTQRNVLKDDIEQIVIKGNGELFYYEMTIHRLLTDKGMLRGSIGVIKDVTDQTRHNNDLMEKAELDGLTHVYNKMTFEKKYGLIQKSPISILIIDIDKFKLINDRFGHPIGDKVLLGIVDAMNRSIRKEDFIGRIGGDEFCLILTECSSDICSRIAKRILENVENQDYYVQETLPKITVSMGALTDINVDEKSFSDIYAEVDLALYEAKQKGRNCLVIKK